MRRTLVKISIVSLMAAGLMACNTTNPTDRAVGGALIGGAGGALVGGLASGTAGGALAGAAIGGAGGAIVGAATAPRCEEYWYQGRRYQRCN